ncbi:DNA gyrase subunit A [Candidatus Pacearchaeota archaeon]|nr:DNA gyrase subunit A [Candidatus Pacearchaeota archaeon]
MTPKQVDESKAQEEVEKGEEQRREKDQIGDEKGVAGAEIVEEMEKSFLDYAMSVIVDRALPSVEDGLKPVHRRILWAMHQIGLDASKSTRKSAAVVGEVLGKYHPHGDQAAYDALVRMAQNFSLRYPLVHGQGNFGSMDGDAAAAMRYTEAKLSKISSTLLQDIEKKTVPMRGNFDDTEEEPGVMPGMLPNLLLNGATGIAVGMATNIPPHNLGEVCDAIVQVIDKPKVDVGDLAKIVTGPDFPTGGEIQSAGLKEMYETGKGRVVMRGKVKIEEKKGRQIIVVTEIPYQTNKSDFVLNIARLATEKKLPDVSDLRDESAKEKVRVVIELKKGATPTYTLNKLYKLTKLQSNFDVNLLALVGHQPKVLNLKQVLEEYVKHRKIVVRKRAEFDLKKAEDRLEIVEGLLKALKQIDKIIAFIKKSANSSDALAGLVKNFSLSERQAKAVLEMRLSALTRLEAGKLEKEAKELRTVIEKLKKLLGSDQEILSVIKSEVRGLKKEYDDGRRTKVVRSMSEISEQDMVEKKDIVVLLTDSGYIKRVDVKTYREQKRGGSGVTGAGLKEEDFVRQLITCSTHDYLLFFTNRGRVYWLKAHEVPDSVRAGKGRALANVLSLQAEQIANVMAVDNFDEGSLFFATKQGMVKKVPAESLSRPRSTGVRAMNLPDDGSDVLVNVLRVQDSDEVLLVTKKGQSIRFVSDDVRSMGRASYGVKGIDLAKGDEVVGAEVASGKANETLLVVAQRGSGKRSKLEDYRKTRRSGKGVVTMKTSAKTGDIVGALSVDGKDSVIATTSKGMVIRVGMKDLRVMGRATQGVKVVKLKEGDRVVDVVKVPRDDGNFPGPESQERN